MLIRCVAAAAVLGLLAGCTSSGSDGPSPSSPPSAPSTGATGSSQPISAGPTTASAVASCPLVATSVVKNTLGQRLGRVTVLRSGGRIVGCRVYASQVEPLHTSEHLPGPDQPVLEIVTSRYPTAVAAHNAFALAAQAGTDAMTVTIGKGVPGVVYRTRFYAKDGARDWACGFSTGTTRVLLRADEDDSYTEMVQLAQVVLRAL